MLGLVHAMWPPVPQTVYIATTSFSCSSSVLCREFVLNEHNGLGPLEVLMALMPTSVHVPADEGLYCHTKAQWLSKSSHDIDPIWFKNIFPFRNSGTSRPRLEQFHFYKVSQREIAAGGYILSMSLMKAYFADTNRRNG